MNHPEKRRRSVSHSDGGRVTRHKLSDRILHWLMAVCMLVLLGTSLLPIFGIKFEWVMIHWVTGLILTLAILAHTIRSAFWQSLSSMWISFRDMKEEIDNVRLGLVSPKKEQHKSGKYSAAQKLYHHLISIVILVAVVTGLIMLVKIDSPFWERNTYWLSQENWGIVYVLHGVSSLIAISLIMVHIYFAFRPEKLLYTRSMIFGWITRDEFTAHHDPDRWEPE